QALLEGLELGQWGAGHGDERGIPLAQMGREPVEIVGPEGAGLAARLPIRREHEVIDDELGLAGEEVRQALPARGPLEVIGLLHALPGQLAPRPAQLVPDPAELL